MKTSARQIFSIIVPVYQNELNLRATIPELLNLQAKIMDLKLELIFVDDGSRDGSFDILKEFAVKFPETIHLVKLTRNFGQIQAIRAGLSACRGRCAGIISADLQDPPEMFLDMLESWRQGFKLVLAEREKRHDSKFWSVFSNLYWRLVRTFALEGYPIGGFDFCIVDRQIIDCLNQIHEKNTQIFPLIFSLGYRFKVHRYTRRERTAGRSQWTVLKKFKLLLDTFIAFSYTPIRVVTLFGVLSAAFTVCYSGYIVFMYYLTGAKVTGWSSLAMLITMFGGLTLLSLGIIGEYLWRILDQVRKRPLYVIESSDDALTERSSIAGDLDKLSL